MWLSPKILLRQWNQINNLATTWNEKLQKIEVWMFLMILIRVKMNFPLYRSSRNLWNSFILTKGPHTDWYFSVQPWYSGYLDNFRPSENLNLKYSLFMKVQLWENVKKKKIVERQRIAKRGKRERERDGEKGKKRREEVRGGGIVFTYFLSFTVPVSRGCLFHPRSGIARDVRTWEDRRYPTAGFPLLEYQRVPLRPLDPFSFSES